MVRLEAQSLVLVLGLGIDRCEEARECHRSSHCDVPRRLTSRRRMARAGKAHARAGYRRAHREADEGEPDFRGCGVRKGVSLAHP